MAPTPLEQGQTLTAKFTVLESDLASATSPDPNDNYARVLATPRLVSFMEITLGTADVFTTIDSLPVARGSFTPTATSTTEIWKTAPTTFYETITVGSWPTMPPNCSQQNSLKQSKICKTYLSSRGLCRDGTTVKPPSVWFDSFACPLPSTNCETYPAHPSGCFIGGHNARLFYFPELAIQTGPDAAQSSPLVLYSFEPGITFTSPSRLLLAQYCVTTTIGVESNTEMVGTTEFAPIVGIPTGATGPIMQSTTAPSSPFDNTSNGFASISTSPPLQITDLGDIDFGLPPSSAYYGDQLEAPGCDVFQGQKPDISGIECNTIFRDLYQPQIVIPLEVTEAQDAWASCLITAGVTATPVALTEVTVSLGASTTQNFTAARTRVALVLPPF